MEPRIQYATSSDGVHIAFCAQGEGRALVDVATGPWGMATESRNPGSRRWIERLARRRMVVLYDNRGVGLSGGVADWSFETQMLDIDAVVDHLGLSGFDLIAPPLGGPVAIAYAAGHPERVSHLLLWSTWARTADALGSPQAQALLALLDKDWEVLTETMAHVVFGWSAGPEAHEAAVAIRESVSRELTREYIEALLKADVVDLLGQLQPPTLVVHCRESVLPALDVAQGLASRIPDARLVVLEGSSAPWAGDMEANARALEEFLGDVEDTAPPAAASGPVTILFTDIEGSTTLTQQFGDARAQEVLRAHNAVVRAALTTHGGSETKHTGDGIMASFPLASSAVACAIAIQRALVDHAAEPGQAPLRVRIGLNAGEPVAEDQDLFGTAVQLARRICDAARAGEILASEVVRALSEGKEFVFADQGRRALKGFDQPVRLYRVEWSESHVGRPPVSNEPASLLTVREAEVLSLLAGGHSGREISVELCVSLSTVQRHIANVYAKIGARGRVEAAAYAIERGLVRSRGA